MRSDIYWLAMGEHFAGRLATSPRPRGNDWLEGEVRAWREANVDHVVSLLTQAEVIELELELEAELCGTYGIDYTSVPVEDRGLPYSSVEFIRVARRLCSEVDLGKSILIHCRQGIGRASLMAAAVLGQAGFDGDSAFAAVENARGRPVPDTPEQRGWLLATLQ